MKFRIREHRNRLGLTLDQLAQASGLTKGYLSLIENDKRDPSAESLRSLAAALHLDVTELISPETDDAKEAIDILMILQKLRADDRQDILRLALKLVPKED